MRHFKNACVALAIILAIAFAYSLSVISRRSRQIAAYESQQAQDQTSIRQLREAARKQQLEAASVEASNQNSEQALRSALAGSRAALKASGKKLDADKVRGAGIRTQLIRSRDQYRQALADANEQLREEKQLGQDQAAVFKRQINGAQAQIQASRLRVNALEALNAKLKNEKPAVPPKAQESANMLRQIQVLDRRREDYLTSVMNRYRQISSQLQAMTGILEANRDANANVFSNQAMYRIRDTLSLANNDLRELDELNAQIQALEKKLLPPQH